MDFVGEEDHGHHDHHHHEPEPKTFADYVKPEYRYT
jgi:cytochrome c oxidase subunit 5b